MARSDLRGGIRFPVSLLDLSSLGDELAIQLYVSENDSSSSEPNSVCVSFFYLPVDARTATMYDDISCSLQSNFVT